MNKYAIVLCLAALAGVPGVAAAQGLGIAGRVGTLGVGGEAAVALGERLVLRGGVGLSPLEPSATFDEVDVTLKLPTLYNVGLDVYLNGAMRLGAGLLFRSDSPQITGEVTTPVEIGGETFTPQELGTLTGVIDSGGSAPYFLIGFGKHTSPGIGLFVDLGVAFLGDPEVSLNATGDGGALREAGLRSELDQEATDFEDDMRAYLKIWPILNIGLRIGVN